MKQVLGALIRYHKQKIHQKNNEHYKYKNNIKRRKCLGPLCKGKTRFLSMNKHNRICPKCSTYLKEVNDLIYHCNAEVAR
jgi:hypothetical protein